MLLYRKVSNMPTCQPSFPERIVPHLKMAHPDNSSWHLGHGITYTTINACSPDPVEAIRLSAV